jgi:transcriptional regulator
MTLYVPSFFRVDDPKSVDAFIARNAFGTLVTTGPGGLQVSHIPFVPERGPDGKLRLLGHVARANPHAGAFESAAELVAIFHGPHAYVSPTWYENHPAVPTWNYAVVHAHGHATALDEAGLRDLLEKLASKYEAGNANPWRLRDAPAEFIDKLLDVIVGFSIAVERVEAKFKLSQNRPGEDPQRVIAALERAGEHELARMMRDHAPRPKSKIPS